MNLNEIVIPADADDAMIWAIQHEYDLRYDSYIVALLAPLQRFGRDLQEAMREFWVTFGCTFEQQVDETVPRLRVIQ